MDLSVNGIRNMILVLVLAVVALIAAANLIPVAQDAGDDLNASGVPLGSLFTSDGVIFILIVAGLLLVFVNAFIPRGRK